MRKDPQKATINDVTVAILAFIACSFGCWNLAARTAGTRRAVMIVLACLALAELLVLPGWIFPGERYSLLVILAVATMITLISGITAEEGKPGARPFRHAPRRVRFGTLLSGLYCTMAAAAIVAFMSGVWAFGDPAATPSSAGVPTPASLSVAANVDQGCVDHGPQQVCSRRISFQVPGADASGGAGHEAVVTTAQAALGEQAAEAVVASMRADSAWPLTAGRAGTWAGCHAVGWFLDTHTVCASVAAQQGQAVVTLTVASDW